MKRSRRNPLIGKDEPQLGLFDEPGDDPVLEVASERDALSVLANRLPPSLRFGTSSWTFPGWAGLVYHRRYPSQRAFLRESLEEYAAHPLMRTVGIDRSYYAPIPEADLALYAAQLPESFKCAMKVWQRVTMPVYPRHPRYGADAGRSNPDFLNPDLFRAEVFDPVQRTLGRAMGPFILEIAPSPVALDPDWFVEKLSRFLAAVPRELPISVELRDRNLLTTGYVQTLRDHAAGHVFNYWSRMPSLAKQMGVDGLLVGSVCVVRLLLPPGAKYADLKEAYAPFDRIVEPQPAMRRDVAQLVEAALSRQMEVYVLVNNKAEGSSPLTVRALAQALAR
ncbi:MAG: DUF72 domain-containing protein [Polyangiales bacterium]